MNILTFDIEEWYIEKNYDGGRKDWYQRFDYYLERILDLLDEQKTEATFFCLGRLAVDFPYVIRRIDERGHEIGCHSDRHQWLTKLSKEQVLEDTRTAMDALEQCIGKKVRSYRAPAFSIGEQNKWAFEILAKCGIERDASVYPATRDFGGFANFGHKTPALIRLDNVVLKEFPICTTRLFGKDMAFSGGGYFRFFPQWFVKRTMEKSDYNMCYFHIGDLIVDKDGVKSKAEFERYFKEPGTLKNRYLRYMKANIGKRSAFGKMEDLIRSKEFVSLKKADLMKNWKQMPIVSI